MVCNLLGSGVTFILSSCAAFRRQRVFRRARALWRYGSCLADDIFAGRHLYSCALHFEPQICVYGHISP